MSSSKNVLYVSNADSQTGLNFISKLLKDSSHKIELIASVADQKGIAKVQAISSEIRLSVVDYGDAESTKSSIQGADTVFIIPSAGTERLKHGKNLILGTKNANAQNLLLLSMIGTENPKYPYSLASEFNELENYAKNNNVKNLFILRSQFYMQNILLYQKQIMEESLPLPIRKGKLNMVDTSDIAEVALTLSKNPKQYSNGIFTITNDNSLDGNEIAAVLSKYIKKDVKFEDISEEKAKELLKATGMQDNDVQGFIEFYRLVRENTMSEVITSSFLDLLQKTPKTFERFVHENIELFLKK